MTTGYHSVHLDLFKLLQQCFAVFNVQILCLLGQIISIYLILSLAIVNRTNSLNFPLDCSLLINTNEADFFVLDFVSSYFAEFSSSDHSID